jgi:protein-disulfide isomerase
VNAKRADAPRKGAAGSKKQGDRSFISLIVVLLIAGAAVLGYVLLKPKPPSVVFDPNAPLPAAKGYVMGSESAPVEIIEFGDFECPNCERFATLTEPDVRKRLVETGLARFRFIDFPLQGHPSTMFAHNAGACADAQQKFWEMHDKIFFGQPEWSAMANGRDMNAPKILKRYAKEIGLDTEAFNTCLDTRQYEPNVRANYQEGERLGVGSTPTFIIGKRRVLGAQPYDVMKALVDSATMEAGGATKSGDTTGK